MEALLRRIDAFFEQRSKNANLLISLAGALAIGILDYFTKVDLLILYLGPIFLASWYGGWKRGLPIAIYCGAASFVTQAFLDTQAEFDPSSVISLVVRLAGYLLIGRTVARLAETRRQQQQLSEFIVHDLRSPISSAISGLLTLQSGDVGEAELEMVDLALVSNQRALGLVNSLLDVSKLESGKMPVEREDVEIEPFLESCQAQIALWAKSQEVELVSEIHSEKGYFDPGLTGRVLVNLLSNALKFSPRGGRILIYVGPWHHALRFLVVDEGPGIPAEYADTIFEPFIQVKGTQGGTGLGLTFCRLAIQAQGGKIRVEAPSGKGTTISVTLPQHHS